MTTGHETEIDLAGAPQRIVVRDGARRDLAPLVRGRAVVVVTDENVAGPWALPLASEIAEVTAREPLFFELEPGEGSKNFVSFASLLEAFVDAELGRDAVVVAVGGGVVSDLAGFAAAVHRRGVEWIAIPTTVVGQVDAAIGGKVGIDVGVAKNAAGAFHPARHVLVDPETLDTLDTSERRAGYAEIWKHALIADSELFDDLVAATGEGPQAPEFLARVIGVKSALCEADPFDTGVRQRLNFGHTIGHALESEMLRRESPWPHGKCVAVGLVAATWISAATGLVDERVAVRVESALQNFGLPTRLPEEIGVRDLERHLAQDKKSVRGELRWVLLDALGSAIHDREVELDVVTAAIEGRLAASAARTDRGTA